MLLRIVILFLIFMLVMGMVQKALSGRKRDSLGQSKRATIDRLRCPDCKRVNFSNNPRACERPECGYR